MRRPDFDGPVSFRVAASGHDVTKEIDFEELRKRLSTKFDRIPGVAGEANVGASGAGAVEHALRADGTRFHAPGPLGLVGGYPVSITTTGLALALPDSISAEEARLTNEAGQLRDGIEQILGDGTVRFATEQNDVLRDVLGVTSDSFQVRDVDNVAFELVDRMRVFTQALR